MGWLRDLMQLSEPAMPSFGRLAKACLEHPDWPADADVRERSLATLFSKLDREQDLDWLRDRRTVQEVVCRVLGRPLGDLRIALGQAPELLASGRILRLRDARFARELDLSREELPPGIPEEATLPETWRPSVWCAPAGAGKSLVRAWLQARGLAQVRVVSSASDWDALPGRGALFVEVAPGAEPDRATLLRLAQRKSPLCLAGRHLEPHAGFELIQTPDLEAELPELVEWLLARLDARSELSSARAAAWLRRVALPHRAVQSFGDLLGLLGALDEFGPRAPHGKSLDELAELYVSRRLSDVLADTSFGPRAKSGAFPALAAAATRVLVRPGQDLSTPRTLDEWAELLGEDGNAADEEWVVRALLEADAGKQETDRIRRAARRLPPGGYRLARALLLAGILAAEVEGSPHYSLGPRWLVSILETRAHARALELSPSDWGLALSDARRRAAIERALADRLAAWHFSPLETLVDVFDASEVELLCALDAALRAAADALLDGVEIPEEWTSHLARLAEESAINLDGLWVPAVALAGASAHRAALVALARVAPLGRAECDPYRTDSIALRLRYAAEVCEVALAAPPGRAGRWLELAEELLAGVSTSQDTLPPLLGALRALCDANSTPRDPVWSSVDSRTLELALAYLQRKDGDTALASAWQRAPADLLSQIAAGDLVRALWQRAPTAIVRERAARGAFVHYAALLPHHYVDLLASGQMLSVHGALDCPLDTLADAVAERGPTAIEPAAWPLLLERAPERLALAAWGWLRRSRADTSQAFDEIPARAQAALLEHLPDAHELHFWPEHARSALRLLLVRALGELGPLAPTLLGRLRALQASH